MAEAGIVPSVGARGGSYDNALIGSNTGLYKAVYTASWTRAQLRSSKLFTPGRPPRPF